jgi:hypothetical protein
MEMSGQRHASAALALGPNPGIHCTGGWVVRSSGRDLCGEWFHLLPLLGLETRVVRP